MQQACDDSRASPASRYRALYTTRLTMTSAKFMSVRKKNVYMVVYYVLYVHHVVEG